MKRPLPKRIAEKTSSPVIRVEAVDSWAHITEFESASDHTLTLDKILELSIPVKLPQSDTLSLVRDTTKEKGIFDEKLASAASTESSSTPNGQPSSQATTSTSLPATFEEYVLSLRRDKRQLLYIVEEFLDLPPPTVWNAREEDLMIQRERMIIEKRSRGIGPLQSHPSAGLSYLRTTAQIENHPLFGPQAHIAPTQGRVLKAQTSATGRSWAEPKYGLAGVVLQNSDRFNTTGAHSRYNVPGLQKFNPDIPGGAKMWLRPSHAVVTHSGELKLSAQEADGMSTSIKAGEAFDSGRRGYAEASSYKSRPMSQVIGKARSSSAGFDYGLGNFMSSQSSAPKTQKPKSTSSANEVTEKLLDDLKKFISRHESK
jgi:hypothetical protein